MLYTCSHEEKISCLERIPLPVMKENTSPAQNDVNLVLCVWSSGSRKRRKASNREHCFQGSALQKANSVLTRWTRNGRLSCGKTDYSATVVVHVVSIFS
jgi:hypothetical protein